LGEGEGEGCGEKEKSVEMHFECFGWRSDVSNLVLLRKCVGPLNILIVSVSIALCAEHLPHPRPPHPLIYTSPRRYQQTFHPTPPIKPPSPKQAFWLQRHNPGPLSNVNEKPARDKDPQTPMPSHSDSPKIFLMPASARGIFAQSLLGTCIQGQARPASGAASVLDAGDGHGKGVLGRRCGRRARMIG